MPRKPRDTYAYDLFDGRYKVYTGITNDPARRAAEHEADGKRFTRMQLHGPARTRESAKALESAKLKCFRRGHGGRNPKYNVNDDG